MQKLSITQEFEIALDVLLNAREERYKHLDKFPELKNVTITSEETVGHILKQTRHISIADSMPAVLSTVMPADSQVLIEESEFDHDSNKHTFKVTPGGNESLFVITGVSHYYSVNDSKAARKYELQIKSSALFISGLIESAIADIYKKNLEKDRDSITHFIAILEEQKDGE